MSYQNNKPSPYYNTQVFITHVSSLKFIQFYDPLYAYFLILSLLLSITFNTWIKSSLFKVVIGMWLRWNKRKLKETLITKESSGAYKW
jgi:membrane-associated PAP2 superfamily phosphatase